MKVKKYIDRNKFEIKNGHIDWNASVGNEIPFIYNDISGSFTICAIHPNRKASIIYNGKEYEFYLSDILKCTFGKMLHAYSYDWKYEIGHKIIINDCIVGVITNRYYRYDGKYKNRYYDIMCSTCKQIHSVREDKLEKQYGCPVCANDRIVKGINDLWTTNPNIAAQLKNKKDGYRVCLKTNTKLDWSCPICHRTIYKLTPYLVYHAVNHIVPCPSCADGFSYPNKLMYNLLDMLHISFENEKHFEWHDLGLRRYDFYIEATSTIIEMHGLQHYRSKSIQKNDIEKEKIAIRNGIQNYIVIDARKTDIEFVWNNIINSQLAKLYDLNTINTDVLDMNSRNSMFKKVFDLLSQNHYNEGYVASILKIHKCTVYKYIKRYICLGLVDEQYVKQCRIDNMNKKYHNERGVPYIRLDTNEVYSDKKVVRQMFPYYTNTDINNIFHNQKSIVHGIPWKRITKNEFNNIKKNGIYKAYGDYYTEGGNDESNDSYDII